MVQHVFAQVTALAQSVYNAWVVLAGVLAFIGWAYRSRIVRAVHNLANAVRHADSLARSNAVLSEQLRASEQARHDWQERFDDLEGRYEAMKAELMRFGEDIKRIRHELTTAEDLNGMLRDDRDALITHTRLLVGQLYANHLAPDYPVPALKSMIAVPGPTRPEETFQL